MKWTRDYMKFMGEGWKERVWECDKDDGQWTRLKSSSDMLVIFSGCDGGYLDRSEVAELHQLLGYWLEHGDLPPEMEESQ